MSEYLEKVNNVIKKYDVRNIKTIVQEALDNGVKAQSILDDAMIPAMDEIGADFKANKVFMPQMLMAAKTMQFGLDVLKPQLAGDPSAKRAGKAVIGSVEGDVHDIGRTLSASCSEAQDWTSPTSESTFPHPSSWRRSTATPTPGSSPSPQR